MQYSKKLLEHFKNPHNQGVIKNPSGMGIVGNPVCGDLMKIYITVDRNIIKDIKFETLGCASAIAVSSMVTELAKGKTLEQAKSISRDDIAEALDGMPAVKMHCSNLADRALKKAIEDYEIKRAEDRK